MKLEAKSEGTIYIVGKRAKNQINKETVKMKHSITKIVTKVHLM
jgi:hypothetical protein